MDIEKEALRVIAQAAGAPIFLFGAPIGTGQQKDQSLLVVSKCSSCGCAVESTELKEKVRELDNLTPPRVALYCQECMTIALFVSQKDFDIEVREFK